MNPLSDFERLNEIGRGNQTVVYRGRQFSLDRDVAIKCLADNEKKDPRKLEHFVRQARFLAEFSHPHLVPVVSVDQGEGWLVMELMQGSLKSCLDQGEKLGPSDARIVVQQVLDALQYLNERNQIHGLIRPSNILFDTSEGVAKLGDFEEIDLSSGLSARKCDFKYLAPELLNTAEFGDIGPRLDLYNLGFTILECMVGPEKIREVVGIGEAASEEAAWMRWHSSAASFPPSIQAKPGLPDDLSKFLDSVLQKSVSDRPSSATAAGKILNPIGGAQDNSLSIIREIEQSSVKNVVSQEQPIRIPASISSRRENVRSSSVEGTAVSKTRESMQQQRERSDTKRQRENRQNSQSSSGPSSKINWKDLSDKRVFYTYAVFVLIFSVFVGLVLSDSGSQEVAIEIETNAEEVRFFAGDSELEAKSSQRDEFLYMLTLPQPKLKVTLKSPFYESTNVDVDTSSGERKYKVNMTPKTASVVVNVDPPEAKIVVDGKTVPPENERFVFKLPLGNRKIFARLKGFEDSREESIEVRSDGNPDLEISLKRITKVVTINVTPSDAEVRWGGIKKLAVDGAIQMEMPVGTQEIVLVRRGCDLVKRNILVKENERNQFDVSLPFQIQTSITPSEASVWVDGVEEIKNTSEKQTLSLPAGTYRIDVKKSNSHVSQSLTLEVGPKSKNRLDVSLAPVNSMDATTRTYTVFSTEPAWKNESLNGRVFLDEFEFPLTEGKVSVRKRILEKAENSINLKVSLDSGKELTMSIDPKELLSRNKIELRAESNKKLGLHKKDEARFLWMYARAGIKSTRSAEFSERQLTEAIELDSNLWQAYRDRAIARAVQGKTELARRDFEKAIETLPSEMHGFSLLQDYIKLLLLIGDEEKGLEIAQLALSRREHATGPLVVQGNVYFQQNNNDAAQEAINSLLKNTTDREQISFGYNLLGLILRRGGNDSEALKNFKFSIDAFPNNANAHLNYANSARSFALKQNERFQKILLESALQSCNATIRLDKRKTEKVLPLLALLQSDLGKFDLAIQTFNRLINEFGATSTRYENRARLYDRIGRKSEANADRVRAKDLLNK